MTDLEKAEVQRDESVKMLVAADIERSEAEAERDQLQGKVERMRVAWDAANKEKLIAKNERDQLQKDRNTFRDLYYGSEAGFIERDDKIVKLRAEVESLKKGISEDMKILAEDRDYHMIRAEEAEASPGTSGA